MTLPRCCRSALLVVRTLSFTVCYVSLAISTAGVAKAVWMLLNSIGAPR